MLADMSPARIRATDSALTSFGTRNTFSDTISATRGTGAARRWLFAQLQQASRDCGGCLRIEYDASVTPVPRHPQKLSANIVNVLGILPGRDTNRVIVMGGHYDSLRLQRSGRTAVSIPPASRPAPTTMAREPRPSSSWHGSCRNASPKGLDATVIFVLHAAESRSLGGRNLRSGSSGKAST